MDIAIVITGIWCFGTLFLAIYDWNQVRMTEDKDLPIHKRRFESFSTNLSMIGVLGTFIGITWGLLAFDSENLDASVPRLLDGLKFAFLTSIFGMLSSSVINKTVNKRFDSLGDSDMTTAALNLSKTVGELKSSIENNNTKVLETAMNQIAKTFQEEMGRVSIELNGLIKRLVDENFIELNNSIKNLNKWQQENKISMDEISETSSQIIADLDTAMSDDYNFVEISNNLSSACRDINESVTDWRNVIRSLDEWLKTQQNYKNSIESLVSTLDELNKQRDYNDEFWKTTRQGMDKATSIISNASVKLEDEVLKIDKQFYERLNATFTNLDRCIQKFMKG